MLYRGSLQKIIIMKSIFKNIHLAAAVLLLILFSACQKMDRPPLGEIIEDPAPPPYNDLKAYWPFEDNLNDEGESDFTTTSTKTAFVTGVNGQGIMINPGGYVLVNAFGDTTKYPNEFVGIPADTLANLGSYTISFWMNEATAFDNGAQGLFAISNKNQFWGNLEIFLENYINAADKTEAFLKIHMYNDNRSGGGEQWTEVKIPGVFGKWSQIAVTYEAATSKLNVYANGQPTAIANKILDGGNYGALKFKDFNGMVLGNFAFQTTPSLTNHGPEDWAKSFNGSLDQYRIYNRALSATEITELYTTKK